MSQVVQQFTQLLHTAFSLYFRQESEYSSLREIPLETEELNKIVEKSLTWEEEVVLLLAIMPHIYPQGLDLFFIQNKELDRPYTEFGGWKGNTHSGFLPTGETAAFLLTIDNPNCRPQLIEMLGRDHWFYKENILRIEGQVSGEPFLSGKLTITEEFLAKFLGNKNYKPEYSAEFPAKPLQTKLNWDNLVLPIHLKEDLENISTWIENENEIRNKWDLNKYVKPGYRCLFYGPPGTGKTLAATLLGKKNNMDVFRIDLSLIVSKYIGETEKNLAKIFDIAEHKNWILFFDEADALFGQRSEGNSSNDRHANQEIAYLLQRIEDFNGVVILATNLKDNMDEAFFRRFQSILFFPMPDYESRKQLWTQMMPDEWLEYKKDDFLNLVADAKISGGSMINVLQRCALEVFQTQSKFLTIDILQKALKIEQEKEGQIISN